MPEYSMTEHELKLKRQRMMMARLRAERRGQYLGRFPGRERHRDGAPPPLKKFEHRKLSPERQHRLENGGLVCAFDDIGGPVHGDALERLERIA